MTRILPRFLFSALFIVFCLFCTQTAACAEEPAPCSLTELMAGLPEYREESDAGLFYYPQLSALEKMLYHQLAQAVDAGEYAFSITMDTESAPDQETLTAALSVSLQALRADQPWYSATVSSSFGCSYSEDMPVICRISLENTTTDYQLRYAQAKLRQIVSTMGEGDRFTRIARLLTYINQNISYDWDAVYLIGGANSSSSNTILGGLLYQKAVCEGFSFLIKAACDAHGIPCIIVYGEMPGDPNYGHAWNYVQLEDGAWYLIDGTDICQGTAEQVLETWLYRYPLKGASFKEDDAKYAGQNGLSQVWFFGTGDSIVLPTLSAENYCDETYDWDSYVQSKFVFDDEGLLFLYLVNGDQETCTVTGFEGSAAGDRFVIPETLDGFTVTAIGANAFHSAPQLTGSLIIPDSVTSIGDYAFYDCTGLDGTLTLPENVTCIGAKAFMNCPFHGQLVLPESLSELGNAAFYNCVNFTGELNVPAGIHLLDHAFDYCYGLEAFSVSEENETYSSVDGVIYSKDKTELVLVPCAADHLNIPDSVTRIHDGACASCRGLKGQTLVLPPHLEIIENDAFLGTPFGGDLFIPDSVTSIGGYAFTGASDGTGQVRHLHVSGSLQYLGPNAFMGCHFSGTVFLPDSLTVIDLNNPDNPWSPFDTLGLTIQYSCKNTACMRCAYELYHVGGFLNYGGFQLVHTGEIVDGTCSACGQPASFTLPDVCPACGYTYNIGVVTREPVCAIGADADGELETTCKSCGHTYTARIRPQHKFAEQPEPVESMPGFVRYRCVNCDYSYLVQTSTGRKLIERYYLNENLYAYSFDGSILEIEGTGLILPENWELVPEHSIVTVGSGIEALPDRAFQNDLILTTVTLPESLQSLGRDSFDHCPALEDVYYSGTEEGWTSLIQNSELPPSLSGVRLHIGERVFLETERTPATCETDGTLVYTTDQGESIRIDLPAGHVWNEPVYSWSEDDRSVRAEHVCALDPTHTESETVAVTAVFNIHPTPAQDGYYAWVSLPFENPAFTVQEKEGGRIPPLDSMTALSLPEQLTRIESEAFAGVQVQAVLIPDSVRIIESGAFANCPDLLYVLVPSGDVSIAEDAFVGCEQVIIDRFGE